MKPPIPDPEEDKSQWTEERLQEEITSRLSNGTYLTTDFENSVWVLRLIREEQELDRSREDVVWTVEHFDKKYALFEAYKRLAPRPAVAHDIWSPNKPRPTPETVTRSVVSKEPDPEDVDPEWIASVYDKSSS